MTHFDNGKKIMYLAKEFLLSSEVIYISGTTNSAGTAARAAEGLVRFGYVTIENGRKRTRFVVTIKKTKDFDKLYKENEEKRKQKEEERKKEQEKKKEESQK